MTLIAPTVDTRVRIPKEVIREMVTRIALQFKPIKIILFGSYAHGKPRPESDVDLLIVMNTNLKESEQALHIRQYINPLFGVDILVYTPARLKERLGWGDSFLEEITSKGRVMYESPDA
ncbi:MAG TPA: nucleotidyltransferase domain-containing protein [Anaerolineaceae bacterium]|nr:nucleotidyltransferase domain-containing protein [Anaerolineaceae bacterium]